VLVAIVFGALALGRILNGGAPPPLALPPAKGIISGPPVRSPISGTWTVTSGSQAGFRVEEVLFGAHHTAVGRTSKVTGGIKISGTTVDAADFTVDMQSVTTDAAGRNVAFHDFILKTGSYPHATFRLERPISLGSNPPEGKVVAEHAVGAVTLRGVTRTVAFNLQAERLPTGVEINARIPIRFGLWHIPNPSFAIAKVGNTGTIEVLLHLKRQPASG
jgi:polyisoprenoid-binding protein YceI